MAVSRICEAAYKFHGPRDHCAYCGEPSDTIDHTVPVSYVSQNINVIRTVNLIKVAACRECNGIASSVLDASLTDRKLRIAKSVHKRGQHLLKTAHFFPDEIEEMGRALRDFIAKADADATTLRRRLAVLADPSWPPGVPDDIWSKAANDDDTDADKRPKRGWRRANQKVSTE
jgi:hypothetical protein